MGSIRIDKYISSQLGISRSAVKEHIKKGSATVNGRIIRDSGFAVDTQNEKVIFCGKEVNYKEYIYIVMNKPSGILSASNDKTRKTVVDLVPDELKRNGLFPVGRLDKDTTGLLIITNDGVFAHNCIAPKKKIPKRYIAELDGTVTDDMTQVFASGVTLADNTVLKPAKLKILSENTAEITITEGKYHQIKRMFGTVGLGVNKLCRKSIGNLILPENLKEGECFEIDGNELKKAVNMPSCTF